MNCKRVMASFLMGAILVSDFGAPVLGIDFGALDVSASVINYADASSNVDVSGIKAFVTRLYQVCLNRNPEEDGLNGWTNQLINRQATGCSVAYGFIFSPEFIGKNHSNEDFVNYMYDAFFGREADEGGFNYWVDLLNQGASKEFVFCGFANSQEFSNLCNSYGVVRGFHIEGYDFNQVGKVNLFVDRLYRIVLNRECDDDGMGGWTLKLLSHEQTGCDVAYGFVFSPEFLNRHTCDDCYVEILYNAFLGRSSDEGGKASWVGKLTEGASREEVFNGFAGSLEFAGICADYGIEAGSLGSGAGVTHAEGTCTICGQGNGGANNGSTTGGNGGSSSGGSSNSGSNNGGTTGGSSNGGSSNGGSNNGSSNNSSTTTPTPIPEINAKEIVYPGFFDTPHIKPEDVDNYIIKPDVYSKADELTDGIVEYCDNSGKTIWHHIIMYIYTDGTKETGWVRFIDNQGKLIHIMYFDDETGVAYQGWHNIDGVDRYFVEETGEPGVYYYERNISYLAEGPQLMPNGERYFFIDGIKQPNGIYSFTDYWDNEHTVYVDERGIVPDGIMIVEVDGVKYGFNNGYAITGMKQIDGELHFFDEEGKMQTGFIKYRSEIFYADSDGIICDGWVEINERKYYFYLDSGCMATGIWCIDGKVYNFAPSGELLGILTGWVHTESNGKTYTYYADSEGNYYTHLHTIDGKKYYFGDYGVLFTGLCENHGDKYYADENGVLQTEWQKVDNKWYYFNKSTCRAVKNDFIEYEGYEYHFDKNGVMDTGWVEVVKDGKTYWYYCKETPSSDDDKGPKGSVIKSAWREIKGSWYYFDADGIMHTGWLDYKGKKYYFEPTVGSNEGKMVTGKKTISGSEYYFYTKADESTYSGASEGAMATNVTVNGVTYGSDGKGK